MTKIARLTGNGEQATGPVGLGSISLLWIAQEAKVGASSGASLYALILFHELKRESASVGLQRLLNLVADGQLRPHIAIEAPWT